MLVLQRKQHEEVIIGDAIIVRVVDIRGDKVRLGFEAPKEMPVHRREVWEAIQAEIAYQNRRDEAPTEVLTEEASAEWIDQLTLPLLVVGESGGSSSSNETSAVEGSTASAAGTQYDPA